MIEKEKEPLTLPSCPGRSEHTMVRHLVATDLKIRSGRLWLDFTINLDRIDENILLMIARVEEVAELGEVFPFSFCENKE